jgi:hypothetical protein
VNRYGYVGNNPLRRIDPSGFTAFEMEELFVRATRIDAGGGGGGWTPFGQFWGLVSGSSGGHLWPIARPIHARRGACVRGGVHARTAVKRGGNSIRDQIGSTVGGIGAVEQFNDFITSPRVVNFSAGVGDVQTFGLKQGARKLWDIRSVDSSAGADVTPIFRSCLELE